jgi:D-alanyl-D-alanine carboxypeptidase
MAQDKGRNLVSVVLKDKNPYHYVDTKALLDLGFNQTENQPVNKDLVDVEKIRDRLVADTIVNKNCSASDLTLAKDMVISVPVGADQSGVSYELNYNLPEGVSDRAVAELQYLAEDGRTIGRYIIEKEPSVEVMIQEVPTETKVAVAVSVSAVTIGAVVAFFVFGSGTLIGLKNVHDDRKLKRHMKERRKQRLQDLDISEEEFRELVEQRRARKKAKE